MKLTVRLLPFCALVAVRAACASAQSLTSAAPDGSNLNLPAHAVGMPAASVTGLVGVANNPATSFAPIGGRGNFGGFSLVIAPGPTLAANAPAMAAFNHAANAWSAYISDPITVTISADLAPLDPNIIGSTFPIRLLGGFDTVRDQLIADAADEPSNAVVASVPTAATYSSFVPVGFTLGGQMLLTKANAKAMGFVGLDQTFGVSDGIIRFSTNFSFDFDRSNGVTPGQVDFQTVAMHEIAHILGFTSNVDQVDNALFNGQVASVTPTPLDLFRFENDTPNDPTTLADFATFPRSLVPGAESITDDLANEWQMSTGGFAGDGRQASHWKDDSLTGTLVGVMDPSLPSGVAENITSADLRALDLIGYEIVPEPSSVALLIVGMLCQVVGGRCQFAAGARLQ